MKKYNFKVGDIFIHISASDCYRIIASISETGRILVNNSKGYKKGTWCINSLSKEFEKGGMYTNYKSVVENYEIF